jgi:hypothetical protein
MLRAFIERLNFYASVRRLGQLPLVKIGQIAVKKYWIDNDELNKDFSRGFVENKGKR